MARTLAFIALGTLGPGAAAGSNLADGYPEHTCGERPEVPERPEKFETEEAIVEYNAKVDAYNASMERLVECLNEYVANAAADIERMCRRARTAVAAHALLVHQRWRTPVGHGILALGQPSAIVVDSHRTLLQRSTAPSSLLGTFLLTKCHRRVHCQLRPKP